MQVLYCQFSLEHWIPHCSFLCGFIGPSAKWSLAGGVEKLASQLLQLVWLQVENNCESQGGKRVEGQKNEDGHKISVVFSNSCFY